MSLRITTRNARFQQWEALLSNRTKRHRQGEFLVQGVRPITLAVEHGWTIRTLISDGRPRMSRWAAEVWETSTADQVVMAPELVAELGEKDEPSELLAVVEIPPDSLDRLDPTGLTVVFDRPTQPGNLGTLARSADAFGATGLIVTGHAADPYDPRAVRSSTGSLFALTVVRAPSHREVLEWARPHGTRIVGTDETGVVDVRSADLTGPMIVVVGNETTGMTAGWREACDQLVSIPMAGAASSLNAATAGSIVLEEALRQRR
ncbi:MAG: 23S rRNA (uridine(2479)-2'-O)-methyltransferase [uncultured Nocardioides sp.]|uniref:23S rRNA (Uridine(2479)-2'-O)-methyltransferase n=1 Tax=uncultured Nocardioides sp. TaxID=198441 RepID=A0A6J4N5B7_9ACTN|nr:MAG: 23S rRNA (uridine(2479)-2'-O)-methyltransferase [uncultured Nocardioides sp.]